MATVITFAVGVTQCVCLSAEPRLHATLVSAAKVIPLCPVLSSLTLHSFISFLYLHFFNLLHFFDCNLYSGDIFIVIFVCK